jgi:hypothetical protein
VLLERHYTEHGYVVQDAARLNAFTQRIYTAASHAEPARGAALDLPNKKRPLHADPQEQQERLKTETYELLLDSEQNKGKF